MTLISTAHKKTDNWDFRGCNTQYGTHGIHTYVAAMIPQLAKRLIDRYAPVSGTVLDPFCGGGAVLVEAICSGRTIVGRDVNELAILISKAKTTHLDEMRVKTATEIILEDVDRSPQLPLVDQNTRFWFKEEHLSPLYSLRQSIADNLMDDNALLPLFLTVFSATVRDVSLTYRNEIRLRRMSPTEIKDFRVDPIKRFRNRIERAAVAVASIPPTAQPDLNVGTVQTLDLRDDECDAIVCSPPYGDERNGVSYTQFSKNMLRWLGYSHKEIRDSKELTLGWGKKKRVAPHSKTLIEALNVISGFPSSVREAIAFYADYQVALAEMARVTKGPVVIVIGQRVMRDTIIDNEAITTELMQNIGVQLTESFHRQLPSKRLPRMRKFGAAINHEAILVFQK